MTANPYYPVTTVSDSSHLADDEWGLTMPSVQYAKHSRTKRFKSACEGVKNLPRCAVIIFVTVCVFILICIIIAVAASNRGEKHPTGNEPMRVQQTLGLNFYPVPADISTVIRFKKHSFKKDEPIKKTMDEVLEPYSHAHQQDMDFTTCTHKVSPYNKTCMFPLLKFGQECTRSRDYGYAVNLPCVLVQLDLPADMTISPINENSPLWEVAQTNAAVQKHEGDPSVVPFSCEGATKDDRKMFSRITPVGRKKKHILYSPEDAFPSFFYRKRDLTREFLKPAVMVQFTSLLDLRITHVKCTAWGQVFHQDGKMVDHGLLETTFAIYIEV